jgi:hypothetical protein
LKKAGLEPTNDSNTLSLSLIVNPVHDRTDQTKFFFQPVTQSGGKSLDFVVGASIPKDEADALDIGMIEPAAKRRKVAEESEETSKPTSPKPSSWCSIM